MKVKKIIISLFVILGLITTTTYAVETKLDKNEWDGITALKNAIINLMPKQAFIIENVEYNDIEYTSPSVEFKEKSSNKLFLWLLTQGLA